MHSAAFTGSEVPRFRRWHRDRLEGRRSMQDHTVIYTRMDTTPSLEGILEGHRLVSQITQFLRRELLMLTRGQRTRSLRINTSIACRQEDQGNDSGRDEANLQSMAKLVSWRVMSSVKIGRAGSCKVADTDLDTHTDSAFVAARKVVAEPCNVTWLAEIECRSCDEDACVGDARLVGRNAHDESDELEDQTAQDPDTADPVAVRKVRYDDRNDGCRYVDRYRQQLCRCGLVAEFFDDRRQK